jgi:hypothetical protein
MLSYLLSNLQSFLLKLSVFGGEDRAWTKDEFKALLLDYHVNHVVEPKRAARTRAECELQYTRLYSFALEGRDLKSFIPIAIDWYFTENIGGKGSSEMSNTRAWSREEISALFIGFYEWESELSILNRTDLEKVIVYYVVLGAIFLDWDPTLGEGISAVIKAYYEKSTLVEGPETIKRA